MMKPFCFILMPFGVKQAGEIMINFDQVYTQVIRPAVIDAQMEPIRADEEKTGGIIHKAMFERLILCEYAIADLTGANANVFYELGVRHAIKPYTTVLLFAETTRLPFDVTFLRALPYIVKPDGSIPDKDQFIKKLTQSLNEARKNKSNDSPLFQLLEDYPEISHEKTDIFRRVVEYANSQKEELTNIRNSDLTSEQKLERLKAFELQLGDLNKVESGVLVDLFLSYRDFKGYEEMISLIGDMPQPLPSTVLIREQLGFALNRLKRRSDAEEILNKLVSEKGSSSETLGILGRVYKDQWQDAQKKDQKLEAAAYLKKSIEIYRRGFNADLRDAYPGVNAVTLMFIEDPKQNDLQELIPVVRYAVKNKINNQGGDYWDAATLFELAILERDKDSAQSHLEDAVGFAPRPYMLETTINNLKLIREAREKRGDNVQWMLDFEDQLTQMI